MWKKIVDGLRTALTIVTGLGQVKQGDVLVTQVKDFLTETVGVVNDVETIHATLGDATLTGEQKLQAAASLIAQDVLAHPALSGHKISDPVLFNKAMVGFAQAAFDLQKSIAGDNVATINKTA